MKLNTETIYLKLSNINDVTILETISWQVSYVKKIVNDTYSEAYKQALLSRKQELNRKTLN